MQYKKLFKDQDVLNVATKLIKKNGQTTTLEVKQELRNQRFWAVQADVSGVMDALAESGLLEHNFGAPYRTYTLPKKVGFRARFFQSFRK